MIIYEKFTCFFYFCTIGHATLIIIAMIVKVMPIYGTENEHNAVT